MGADTGVIPKVGSRSSRSTTDQASPASRSIVPGELDNYESEVLRLTIGSAVAVESASSLSRRARASGLRFMQPRSRVYGLADPDEYPLQKKRISYEKLRDIAHLRPRTNTFGAVARVRNALAYATHQFYQERDFLYLHTPMITSSDAEGAGEMFQVTTLDIGAPPRIDGDVDYTKDFFGKPTYLTVSGQLSAETYASALDRVYTFGPTFRAENSNTRRHLAEFWMIEPEIAFADLSDNADLAEDYIKYMFQYVLENCPEDLEFFNKWVEGGSLDRLDKRSRPASSAASPTPRLLQLWRRPMLRSSSPSVGGADLQSEHERYLTEVVFDQPVIVVTDYPKDIKAFYMRRNDDGKTVAAMDVLLPGVGEIVGGSQREERHDVLLESITEKGLPPDEYWWYLDLRRFGSVPHAGFGLGFGRMVQFVTGMQNIRDVIPYPRTPNSAEF